MWHLKAGWAPLKSRPQHHTMREHWVVQGALAHTLNRHIKYTLTVYILTPPYPATPDGHCVLPTG